VPGSLTDLIEKLSKSAKDVLAVTIGARIKEVSDYLRGLEEIRIFIANSQNFGHQSSSVNILRNLIRMGCAGPYTLALYGRDDMEIQDLIRKLEVLIVGFPGLGKEFVLGGCKVTAVSLLAGKLKPGNFAITGGFDEHKEVPYDTLNVLNYVQLQPYQWHKGVNLVITGADGDIFDLDKLNPTTQLKRRAFYLPLGTTPDWAALANTKFKAQAEIVKYLTDQATAGQIHLLPGYGFTTPGVGDPYASLYNTIAGALAAQTKFAQAQRKTVLVGMQVLQKADDTALVGYLKDIGEKFFKHPVEPSVDFVTWNQDVKVNGRVELDTAPTLDDVTYEVGKLAADGVLYVQIGPIASDLFNYLYEKATLPPLLEGQATAELMLNIGKPYFKMGRDDLISRAYPTLPMSSNTDGDMAKLASGASFNGISFALPNAWNKDKGPFPPTVLMDLFGAYLGAQGVNAKIAQYFTSLGAFYHDELNDKLLRGLDLFVNLIGPAKPKTLMAETAAAPAGSDVLEKLYASLQANLKNGQIDLFAVTANWLLGTFFTQIVPGKTFVVDNAVVAIDDEKTQVTLTGTTTALGIGATGLDFVFTDDKGAICSVLGAVFSEATWSLPGAPWLSLGKPGLQLTLDQNAAVPVVGKVTASLSAGFTMDIAVELPSEPGNVLLQAVFTGTKPSITNFFQLVGGINLQAYLPQQLQILSDIQAQVFELRYDYKANKAAYVGIQLATPSGSWDLIPAVTATGITFSASVQNPGDLANRTTSYDIGGTFTVGGGNVAIDAKLPGLRVTGGLADDSPPILLSSIVAAYLGSEFASALPQSVASTQIAGLTFWVDRTVGSYSFAMDVNANWNIPETSPLFVVDQLNLAINADSNAIDPGPAGGSKGQQVVRAGKNGASPAGTVVTGSFSGSTIILPESKSPIGLVASAAYGGADAGWTFEAKQTSGKVELAELIKHYLGWDTGATLNIAGLGLTVTTIDGAWTFTGSTPDGDPWVIPFLGLSLTASLKAGKAKPDSKSARAIRLVRNRAVGGDGLVPFAHLETKWSWKALNIDLQIWFDYSPEVQKFGITWNDIIATMSTADANGDYTATIKFDKNTTLGSIVETMVSWMTGSKFSLESPWDVLNGINLSNLALSFVFNPKDKTRDNVSLSISIGPINLGIARIDGVEITYGMQTDAKTGKKVKGVHTALTGSFPWNVGDTAIGDTGKLGPWDASQPGAAPAPPGHGNKYFDLRLLAMGQHIAVDGLASADTVQKAIDCFNKLPVPDPNDPTQKPGVSYDAHNSWLVGTEFGVLRLGDDSGGDKQRRLARAPIGRAVITNEAADAADDGGGYMLTVQIVFDDPDLYGLRIKLAGDVAKIFKGLDFQIMYRQVSDTVGVYQAEIVLPDAMRIFSVGVYTITLPIFGVWIYTNGDFKVDIGFPWNEDFTRSFSIEGIIYPGIPVVGAAGFYFAKLSSATSTSVPRAINGTFNPVIEFGFGMQVGFGKSIQYGILSAGFSLTAFGIIEGVLGKWNPYQITDGGGEHNQLQGDYYFWLQGTVGIIGKLFGSINFVIIKADVNVTLQVMLQLTYESYVSITVSVIASVDVAVSVSIDLGLFSITLHFSFSMRLKETFTLPMSGTPPWQVATGGNAGLLAAPPHRRLKAHRMMLRRATALDAAPSVNWDNLTATAPPVALAGYLVPALAAASDEWSPQDQTKQMACYVAMLVIKSVPSAAHDRTTSALKATGQVADTPFELLCKMVLRWAVAALHGAPISPDQADLLIVDDDLLVDLIETVLVSSDDNPTPIKLDAARKFLNSQFRITVGLPPNTKESADATFLPIAPEVKLTMPAYGSNPAFSYVFSDYNSLDHAALKFFRDYFDALAVQVQQEMKSPPKLQAVDSETLSMASWILTDYFLLLARQMVQAARDALRDFKYPIDQTQRVQDIIDWINAGMQGPPARGGAPQSSPGYTIQDLFIANATHPLVPGSNIAIGAVQLIGAGGAGTSFTSIAQSLADEPFAPSDLAAANGAAANILHAGATITLPGPRVYTVQPNDTLFGIARTLAVPLSVLFGQSTVLGDGTLLEPAQPLFLPYAVYHANATDTFASVAQAYGNVFDAPTLATQNAGRAVLTAGVQITCAGVDAAIKQPYVVPAQGCLADVATYFSLPLADLIAKAQIANVSILSAPGLLAPVAALIVPPFTHTVSSDATPDKTLQQIADRFGVKIEVLGAAPANLGVTGLFATVDGDKQPAPYLDVPHLPRFQLAEILKEVQRALALQHLSGMASRYYLHGLRLPTDHVKPNAVGMWVQGMQLPPMAGLYALTGQQVPVPSKITGSDFTITLDRSAGPDWLVFVDGNNNPTNQLTVAVAPSSTDAVRINTVYTALASPLDVKLLQLGAEQMYQSDLATYPLSSSRPWQSAIPIALPYGSLPAGNVPVLRLWKLPSAMVSLPDLSTRSINPRFKLQVARYDEATGATVTTPVDVYGWASVVDFTIKRVPQVNEATATTYEIAGAGAGDTVLLEHLLDEVLNESEIDSLILAYASDGSSGIQNDALSDVTAGIAKVNLSTETRPPSGAGMRAMLFKAEQSGMNLLNTKLAFIRMLWEASITRTGGSFLYYYNATAKAGLPDRIFNDKNEAVVTLIVVHARPAAAANQNRLASYMNMAATGEGLDTGRASLIAQADPPVTAPDNQVAPGSSDSLASLAEGYFSNVGDLALANSTLALTAGVQIVVSEGLYQAPPGGIALSTVASNFNTSTAELTAANQPWYASLPATLDFPMAIRLPRLTLIAGKDAHTSSLQDVATYYGENLTALAAHNRGVVGLFATSGGQNVTIPGGPRRRAATVPPGVQALGAARTVPDPVPLDPTVAGYAQTFLLNAFSLLNYQLTETPYFKPSPIGLPAGATTHPDSSAGGDKLRAPRLLAAGDTWDYRISLPYPRFAKPAPAVRLAGLPALDQSPYIGVGRVMQVAFDWLDHYGNRIVTTLAKPTAASGPFNQAPVLTGYTDALLGLGQWPSVSSAWHVVPPVGGGPPQLELRLAFSTSRYSGLMQATATNTTTVTAAFTDPLDPPTATDAGNYTLSDGINMIAVQAASLSTDGLTVTLTVGAMADGGYTLTTKNLQTKSKTGTGGQATFASPPSLLERSSTVQKNAQVDLRTYTQLFYQLTDPNGTALSFTTSLLADTHGRPLDIALTQQQLKDLLAWLFDTAGLSIYHYLTDRSDFGTAVAPPAPAFNIDAGIDVAKVNPAEIFELIFAFTIARTGGAVQGDMETTPGVKTNVTNIAPLTGQFAQPPSGQPQETRGLTAFAQDFESALYQPGVCRIKLATGVDRSSVGAAATSGTLWGVRLGLTGAQGIWYDITAQTRDNPAIFSPRPVSNQLQTRKAVSIYDYTSGQGISPTATRVLDFVGIDMDIWIQQLVESVDELLMPEYTASIEVVGRNSSVGYLDKVLQQKMLLAGIAQWLMVPVFRDDTTDPVNVRGAFYQQLLSRLSNLYAVRAGLQFMAKVNADLAPPEDEHALRPRLDRVTIVGADPTHLAVYFSDAMGAAAAVAANYTVSDSGQTIGVNSATLSSDRATVTLALAAAATPGQTTVAVAVAVQDAAGGALWPPPQATVSSAPRLFGDVVVNAPRIDGVYIPGGSATQITVRFSDPMDMTKAANVGNYTVTTAGLPIKVNSASIQNPMSVVLGLAAAATPGATKLAVNAAVTDAQGSALYPPLELTVGTNFITAPKSQIAFSSPKLNLATADDQPLALLLDAAGTGAVRDDSGDVVSAVQLDLRYNGTNIEHQIGASVGRYQPSSWLGFVVGDADRPLTRQLGRFAVPMVLRSFPTTPVMVDQTGEQSPTNAAPPPLSALTKWDYHFIYSLPFHYPQDRVYGTVDFNIQDANLLAEDDFLDAFDELAEFVTVVPAIQKDFAILASIDAATDPVKDKDKFTTASVALASYIGVLSKITAKAGPQAHGLNFFAKPRRFFGTQSLKCDFYIQECGIQYGSQDSVLLVSFVFVGALPADMGPPSVVIDSKTYTVRPYPPSTLPPGSASPACDGQSIDNQTRFGFIYELAATPGQYLSAADGQAIAQRDVVLTQMDILQRQDAWSTLYLKRNEELVPGRPSAEPFIYRTPDIQFVNPLHPTIDTDDTVDMSLIGASNPKQPVARTLPAQIQNFFSTLLQNNVEPTLTIQVEITYAYSIASGLDPVPLPVLVQPPIPIQIAGAGPGTLQDMIANWSAAVARWFTTYVPSPQDGTICFDLTIMSSLTKHPMPLLRLRKVVLPIAYTTPPPVLQTQPAEVPA
jgi:hypothetical protein